MSERPAFKDFDIPVQHLNVGRHYVPPKARAHESEEIERRRLLPPGTLLAEHQLKGLSMFLSMLRNVEEPPSVNFLAWLGARMGLNGVWYQRAYGADNQVQRRRAKLPRIALENGEPPIHPNALLPQATENLSNSILQADLLVTSMRVMPQRVEYNTKWLANRLGTASLALACIELPYGPEEFSPNFTDYEAQLFVRRRGLVALRDSRVLHHVIGSHPSPAALAHPDSDLSVFVRREAPDEVAIAFERARTEPIAA